MQNFADVVKQKQSTNVIYAFVPSASISVWKEDCLEDFLEVAAPLSDEPLLAELAGPLQYIQRLHCPKNKLNLRIKYRTFHGRHSCLSLDCVPNI